jgi:hypothetical protein
LSQFIVFKEFAVKQKPERIFWFFYDNDVAEFAMENDDHLLRDYFLNDTDLSLIEKISEDDQSKLDFFNSAELRLKYLVTSHSIYRIFLLGNLKNHQMFSKNIVYLNDGRKIVPKTEKKALTITDVYKKSYEISQKHGIRLTFVILPEAVYAPQPYISKIKNDLEKFFRRAGIEYIDLSSAYFNLLRITDPQDLKKMFPSLETRTETHYTAAVSSFLADFLINSIKCPSDHCNSKQKLLVEANGFAILRLYKSLVANPYATDVSPAIPKTIYIGEKEPGFARLDISLNNGVGQMLIDADFSDLITTEVCETFETRYRFVNLELLNRVGPCSFTFTVTEKQAQILVKLAS